MFDLKFDIFNFKLHAIKFNFHILKLNVYNLDINKCVSITIVKLHLKISICDINPQLELQNIKYNIEYLINVFSIYY